MQIDWRLLLSTFAMVAMAELGDKTQLTTLAMAVSCQSRWVVFAGAALALVTITLVSVVASDVLTKVMSVELMKRVSGMVFILIGAALVLGR